MYRHLSPAIALSANQREIDEEVRLIKDEIKTLISDPSLFDQSLNCLFEDLLKSVMLGFAFEFHRNLKIGLWDSEIGIARDTDLQIVDELGLDIFGQPPLKKPPDCVCPECNRSLTAARFAPHLEKCMGMGRNSSRIAQRRIANNSSSSTTSTVAGFDADDVDDADWTAGSDRSRRKKKERPISKRNKNTKPRNGTSSYTDGGNQTVGGDLNVSYEEMTVEEKKSLLAHICGVVSEHTKRLCTRSMKCPQHSDDQRRIVRNSFLYYEGNAETLGFEQVDVDTYEDGDVQSMRDQLGRNWEQEHSNTNSPADSCSTGSSTQSKKRDKSSKNSTNTKASKKGTFTTYYE